jgi:hypothetical protein
VLAGSWWTIVSLNAFALVICTLYMYLAALLEPYMLKREGDEDSIIGMPLVLLKQLVSQVS